MTIPTPAADNLTMEGFEERFTDFYFKKETFEPHKPMLRADDVREFVLHELDRQREEIVRVLEGMLETARKNPIPDTEQDNSAYHFDRGLKKGLEIALTSLAHKEQKKRTLLSETTRTEEC